MTWPRSRRSFGVSTPGSQSKCGGAPPDRFAFVELSCDILYGLRGPEKPALVPPRRPPGLVAFVATRSAPICLARSLAVFRWSPFGLGSPCLSVAHVCLSWQRSQGAQRAAFSHCFSGGGSPARHLRRAWVHCLQWGPSGRGLQAPSPPVNFRTLLVPFASFPKRAPRRISQPRESALVHTGIGALCGLAAKSSPTTPTPCTLLQVSPAAPSSAAARAQVVVAAPQPRRTFLTPPSHRALPPPRWLSVPLLCLVQQLPLPPSPQLSLQPPGHVTVSRPCTVGEGLSCFFQ